MIDPVLVLDQVDRVDGGRDRPTHVHVRVKVVAQARLGADAEGDRLDRRELCVVEAEHLEVDADPRVEVQLLGQLVVQADHHRAVQAPALIVLVPQ
jgi:hypothetical protein